MSPTFSSAPNAAQRRGIATAQTVPMQCRSAISSRVTDLYRPCRFTKNGWNHGSRLSARGSSILTEPALTTPIRTPADADAALRPKSLAEFVGQARSDEHTSELQSLM